MTFDEAVSTLESLKTRVHTDDLETTIRVGLEHEAIDFAVEMLDLIKNREKHFSEWAKKNKAHVCATCVRASSNRDSGTACPIEDHYALPLDGHCHLWEEVKPPSRKKTMTDRERVIFDIERCICHVPDACRDCSKYGGDNALRCMEDLLKDALELLKEQEARKPDCEHAEHDGAGCLGYAGCSQDDEPIEACKGCDAYTGNRTERR